jgi:asparagine synthase (glutamine-hydrolysing)
VPGVVGFISALPHDECTRRVATMLGAMEQRGGDRTRRASWPDIGFHAGWVAPPHLSAPQLVARSADGDVTLAVTGQVHLANHAAGAASIADLRAAYEQHGEQFLQGLDGQFAGVLVDRARGRAFVFNDRYGLERLYFCGTPQGTYFASEAKALLAVVPASRAFDPEGLSQFLVFRCTRGVKTLFAGVDLCPGGTLWTVERGTFDRGRWFEPSAWEAADALDEPEYERRLDAAFASSMPLHLDASAGAVGVSLTGGLDTRMIMACLGDGPVPVVAYTYDGADGETIDTRLAKQVAAVCGIPHRSLRLGPDFFARFVDHFESTVLATDGCFGLWGAHERYLSRRARELAPVRLTGNYGSEILRDVSTLKPLVPRGGLLNPEFDGRVAALVAADERPRIHPVTFAAFEEIPRSLYGSYAAVRAELVFRTPFLDSGIVSLAYRAPASARESPDAALRFVTRHHPGLGRIPTDRGLVAAPRTLGSRARHLIAQGAFRLEYFTNEGLPGWLARYDTAVQRSSRLSRAAFGAHKFLHYRSWLRHELADFVREQASMADALRLPCFVPGGVQKIADEHVAGLATRARELDVALTLAAVQRLLIAPVARGVPSALPESLAG